jgi:hypothetical protein
MKREIAVESIKKNTDAYLKKNPIKRHYDMNVSTNNAFVEHITWECIHGDIDGLIGTVYDIYCYGFSKGMKQAQNGASMVADASVSHDKYAEVAALLADKGGAGNGDN